MFGQDLRHTVRLLVKAPVVTFVAVLSLALGIGANTAIFGIINALMLRSLPVRDPQRLVSIGAVDPEHPEHGGYISLAMFHKIQKRASVFSDVFVWTGGGMRNIEASGMNFAGTVDGASGDYFSALGIHPMLGRLIGQDDAPLDGRPSAQVAVLSYGAWQRRFGGDPRVLGKMMRVDDIPVTIIGVTPPDFTGLLIDNEPEATIPIGFSHRELKYRESMWYTCLARLKPGVTLSQTRAQIRVLWPGILKATVPDSYRGAQRARFFTFRPEVQPATHGNSFLRERLEKPLQILMVLVGAVLLIACVNLANLLLARSAARQHEFGIRAALGASRSILIRTVLIEALLLSCTGAVIGILIARATARYLLASFWTGLVPLSLDSSPDKRVLLFTAALAISTGVLFGIVPAWQMSRADPVKALSQSARTTGGRAGRFSRALITAQVSLSLFLLIGATLFVRSLENLRNANLGYRSDHLLIMQLFPQSGHEHDKWESRAAYYHALATRLSELPGVASVSFEQIGPGGGYEYKVPVSNNGGVVANAAEEWAGPGFFHMIGMRILAGRDFTWRDDERAPRVVVISQSLARALFPNQNAIGQTINIAADQEHQGLKIIGVVNSASLWKFDGRQPLAIYHALMQDPAYYSEAKVIVRTRANPLSIGRAAERTVESFGYQYVLRWESFEQRASRTLVLQRMIALLASGFSLLALLLAAIGLYGVMSYAVTRRTGEIGVRMAFGALRSDVLWMILREVLLLVTIGIAIALPIAFACGKLISKMLFGVSATDPSVILISASILITAAALAGLVPARRASRVDPMIALRCE